MLLPNYRLGYLFCDIKGKQKPSLYSRAFLVFLLSSAVGASGFDAKWGSGDAKWRWEVGDAGMVGNGSGSLRSGWSVTRPSLVWRFFGAVIFGRRKLGWSSYRCGRPNIVGHGRSK